MVAVVVDLLEVEVEQMSLEGVELRGLGEVGAVMGVGQADEPCCLMRFPSHRLLNGRP